MKEIKLYNRDGADLKLVYIREIEPNISEWKFQVDEKHNYVLEFVRFMGDYNEENNSIDWYNIKAVDPSGGPFISLGDEFENKYKIVRINSIKSICISERTNNN